MASLNLIQGEYAMYNFDQELQLMRYDKVAQGWKKGKIHRFHINNSISNLSRQYIKQDFEMLEEGLENILVPAFFYYRKHGNPDPKFIAMGFAAGLKKDYGNDLQAVFSDLRGRELMVYVVHRYKKGRIRRDQIVNFKPLAEPGSFG